MSQPPIVGLGLTRNYPSEVTFDDAWVSYVEKAYHPDLYLPVTGVVTEEKGGYFYREMVMKHNQHVVKENIYVDKEKGEIRFVELPEQEIEIVNVLHKSPLSIEYFKRKVGGERVPWEIPAAMLEKVFDMKVEHALKETKKHQ